MPEPKIPTTVAYRVLFTSEEAVIPTGSCLFARGDLSCTRKLTNEIETNMPPTPSTLEVGHQPEVCVGFHDRWRGLQIRSVYLLFSFHYGSR